MSTEKINRWIQILSLCICLVVYLDAYILADKKSEEVVTGKRCYEIRLKGGRSYYCIITTPACSVKVSWLASDEIYIDDTVKILRSPIFNFVDGVAVQKGKKSYFAHQGFQANQGIVYLIIVTLGTLGFMIVYRKVKYMNARRDIGIYLLLLSLIMLFLHIWF